MWPTWSISSLLWDLTAVQFWPSTSLGLWTYNYHKSHKSVPTAPFCTPYQVFGLHKLWLLTGLSGSVGGSSKQHSGQLQMEHIRDDFPNYSLRLCLPDNTPNRKHPVCWLFPGWSDFHPLIPWLSSSVIFENVSLGPKHSAGFLWYSLARWSHDLIYA